MKIAFIVSSLGDTDLALNTIKSMENRTSHESILISLTKAAQQRISNFQSASPVDKKSLTDILHLSPDTYPDGICTEEQLKTIIDYITHENINYAYVGVPSASSKIPFQIAEALEDTPILMAYEFMFKPETHSLWEYVPTLKHKSNIQWALPLAGAVDDFELDAAHNIHITGHLSIDNAYASKSPTSKGVEEIKAQLQVTESQSLAFVSSTTQPHITDVSFLDDLFTELPNHPHIQIRLGLHPGIQDLDTYVKEILAVYRKHAEISHQFKIILPDNLVARFKTPDLSIQNPEMQEVFLPVNINGAEAAFAADRVAQAVPGALLNQAVLEGKPSFIHSGKPYLPNQYFASSIMAFFSESRQPPRLKAELGLDEKTAPENYVDIIMMNGM